MKRLKSEKGLLSLEASIAVTIFLFLMLFMYSYFVVFETRNEIAHVLLATTNSLSLDPYGSEKINSSGFVAQLIAELYQAAVNSDDGFVSSELWTRVSSSDVDNDTWDGSIYVPSSGDEEKTPDEYGNVSADSTLLASVVKARFVAYLADGNESEADRILKRYHVVNGLDGLDFSGTHVASSNIYVKVTYTLEPEFRVFNWRPLQFEQSACSKLWK